MRVLVVGGGGREHALAWKLAASPRLTKLWCAPGNPGIAQVAECVPIAADDVPALVAFAREQKVDLVVPGPEAALVSGLVDALEKVGIAAFGPSAAAAELEGSKAFMKDVLARAGVPTAWHATFTDPVAAKAFVRAKGAPIVIKASGLAAGKGVVVCAELAEAEQAIDAMLVARAFGDAGAEVVVEEFLAGEEASFFALVDGDTALPLVAAQDHKAAFDGDQGPNTGGMGAYSPAPVMDAALEKHVMDTCILPTVKAMKAAGRPFKGVLFCGLMITAEGPKVLEYNVRFGDPECQVLMLRLESDLLPVLADASAGRLSGTALSWRREAALVVVMAAKGYPGAYAKGTEIKGLNEAAAEPGVVVFHAGTGKDGDRIVASGGRVLGIAALGRTVAEAQDRAYRAVDRIDWPEGFCRRDIGWRAIARG